MNFQRGHKKEEPEINLVPMIDVLLVILIFLVITTTYSKFSELEITLPQANAFETDANKQLAMIDVTVSAGGEYTINMIPVKFVSIEDLRESLRTAAKSQEDPVIIISADANASHQSVMTVMEAARLAGYNQVTFTTEISNSVQ
ncbi:MAG: biopolymer transporter ExbD [Nitrosomonas sp.]|nr:biopolymer transporter ExbD [Nitrosomonas sp.]